MSAAEKFYDGFAVNYHRMFGDWDAVIERQAIVLDGLIRKFWGETKVDVLDCTCGIGTQAIGLSRMGHNVVGTDISGKALRRAKDETTKRGLKVIYKKMDLRSLERLNTDFHVILSVDNSLPNILNDEDLTVCMKQVRQRLKPEGIFIATIRDYDELIQTRPQMTPPAFCKKSDEESITFQIWDWIADNIYELHQHTSVKQGDAWRSFHHVTPYRALLREELSSCLKKAGLENVEWKMPDESGFFQPLVIASNRPGVGSLLPR